MATYPDKYDIQIQMLKIKFTPVLDPIICIMVAQQMIPSLSRSPVMASGDTIISKKTDSASWEKGKVLAK